MVDLEDFSADKFTELAHWLGFDCRFASIPHANNAELIGAPWDTKGDYGNATVVCGEHGGRATRRRA
jgi:hypothetical protein